MTSKNYGLKKINYNNKNINTNNNNTIRSTISILLLIFLFLIAFELSILSTIPGQDARADYYDFKLETPNPELVTDGKESVEYVITVTNTGNIQDTFSLFPNIKEVTNCTEPKINDWSFELNKTLVTLNPSHSTAIKLTVSSSCDCQVGCKATIEVNGISSGNPSVKKSILTYTTRGIGVPKYGLIIEIDYDPVINQIYPGNSIKIDVSVWNVQNKPESLLLWVNRPSDWTASVSPSELTMNPNSKRIVVLSFEVPSNVASGNYTITVHGQSQESSDNHGQNSIEVLIKPDIIIRDVTFSKEEFHEDENVKLVISVENIGTGPGTDIPIKVYYETKTISEVELTRQEITTLGSKQVQDVTVEWKPKKGEYNLTIKIDPDQTMDELRTSNNIRIEPVTVGDALPQDASDSNFPLIYLMIIIIVIILLIIYFLISRAKSASTNVDDKNQDEEASEERVKKPQHTPKGSGRHSSRKHTRGRSKYRR